RDWSSDVCSSDLGYSLGNPVCQDGFSGVWYVEGGIRTHTPYGATPSRWCVCQFRHFRTRDGERILAGSDRQGKSNVAPKKLPPRWASEGSQEWFPSAQRSSRSYQPTTFSHAVEKVTPAK